MASTRPGRLVALAVALAGAVDSALVAIDSNSKTIQYAPVGSWDAIEAPGAYEGSAMFLLAEPEQGVILFTFPSMLQHTTTLLFHP